MSTLAWVALLAAAAPVSWGRSSGVPGLDARLRTLAVDPEAPERIFAGSADGTVLYTHDGGASWQERPVTPFVVDALRENAPAERTLLDGLRPRYDAQPILRLAICPGAAHRLLALTPSALFGSRDGGVSFVRLFGALSRERLNTVHCDPRCGRRIALASERGLYLSDDGGSTFGSAATPPGVRVDVAEVSCEPGRAPSVWVAQSRRLYRLGLDGRPDDFRALYPGPAPAGKLPAPTATIRDIEVDGDRVWLATDRGVQRSEDQGQTWAGFPNDVGRQVRQVWVDRVGGSVAAVLDLSAGSRVPGGSLDAIAVRTDDDGQTWAPLFAGLSRRRVRWLATDASGRWWLATSSGVWAERREATGDSSLRPWARAELARIAPLRDWVDAALVRADLDLSTVAGLPDRFGGRCWWPSLAVEAGRPSRRDRLGRIYRVNRFEDRLDEGDFGQLEVMTWLSWDLGCALDAGAQASEARVDLARVRSRLIYTVQEAFQERVSALERIGFGVEPDAGWQLWARAEATGAVLRALAGRSVTTRPGGRFAK